jgi:hypothetical protein
MGGSGVSKEDSDQPLDEARENTTRTHAIIPLRHSLRDLHFNPPDKFALKNPTQWCALSREKPISSFRISGRARSVG